MLNSKLLAGSTLLATALIYSQSAWAGPNTTTDLAGPGIVGLIVAAVLGAVAVSRSRK